MANPFCLLVKRPSAVMSEEKRLPFAGWEEERPGGEDKKTMVVLLVFIYDYFGGSFWSEKKLLEAKAGAPNENIVQNHINIALLNVR